MSTKYNESIIRKNKDSFLLKGCLVSDQTRLPVLDSWKRSKKNNLNTELKQITIPPELEKYHNPTKDLTFLRDRVLQDVVSCLYKMLEKSHGALFYAYDNGVIFSQRGNADMLRTLNEMNIDIGACINEEYLGTTGKSLIREPDQEGVVIGQEHYLEILTPYVTHCYYSDDFNGRTYTFVVVPKEQFTDPFLTCLRMFHKARKASVDVYRKEVELKMNSKLYGQLIENKNQAFLFVDQFGKIIGTNQLFLRWFQITKEEIVNQNCESVFPEFKRALSCLITGEKEILEEIQIHRQAKKRFLHMDVKPMWENGEASGLIITLEDSYSVRQKLNKLSNSSAYYTFDHILGTSPKMREIKQKAKISAKSYSSVIITGESGTGKELFAQAIHNESKRRDDPFVAVNCATIQQELIASELFGYVDGAFTGARKGGSMGKFEFADKGTLFLDEVAELPLYAQTMLLRVLEERTVTRVGSNISTPVDVRLICATNRDLKKMVREGTFRLDLYYRINVIHLHLPALRERITDIPLLVNYYIDYYNDVLEKKVNQISTEALNLLVKFPWQGNLRELRNAVECAMNNVMGSCIEKEDFPIDVLDYFEGGDSESLEGTQMEKSIEKDFYVEERKHILCKMIECNGNKSHVAEELGISRSTLYKKLKEYRIS